MNFYYLLISIALSFPLDTNWHEYLASQQDVSAIEIGHILEIKITLIGC